MTSILRFTTADGDFALPVENVRRVHSAADVAVLPDAMTGVTGVLIGDDTVTVTDALGAGALVIVVESADGAVGVLADDVRGVVTIDDGQLGPAPAGQRAGLVGGVVTEGRRTSMLIDPAALVARVTS